MILYSQFKGQTTINYVNYSPLFHCDGFDGFLFSYKEQGVSRYDVINVLLIMNYVSDDKQAKYAFLEVDNKNAFLIKADISTDVGREQLITKTLEKFGRFDVLINNAGILRPGRFLEITPDVFETVMNTNFYAALYLSQIFANNLIAEKKNGAIINILSVGAHHASNISYGTSKAALLFATKCMAKELAQHNIRVNSISPNGVPSNLQRSMGEPDPEQWAKAIKKIPMKRACTAEEVASAAIYLASESASYVTGIDMLVDGGLLC